MLKDMKIFKKIFWLKCLLLLVVVMVPGTRGQTTDDIEGGGSGDFTATMMEMIDSTSTPATNATEADLTTFGNLEAEETSAAANSTPQVLIGQEVTTAQSDVTVVPMETSSYVSATSTDETVEFTMSTDETIEVTGSGLDIDEFSLTTETTEEVVSMEPTTEQTTELVEGTSQQTTTEKSTQTGSEVTTVPVTSSETTPATTAPSTTMMDSDVSTKAAESNVTTLLVVVEETTSSPSTASSTQTQQETTKSESTPVIDLQTTAANITTQETSSQTSAAVAPVIIPTQTVETEKPNATETTSFSAFETSASAMETGSTTTTSTSSQQQPSMGETTVHGGMIQTFGAVTTAMLESSSATVATTQRANNVAEPSSTELTSTVMTTEKLQTPSMTTEEFSTTAKAVDLMQTSATTEQSGDGETTKSSVIIETTYAMSSPGETTEKTSAAAIAPVGITTQRAVDKTESSSAEIPSSTMTTDELQTTQPQVNTFGVEEASTKAQTTVDESSGFITSTEVLETSKAMIEHSNLGETTILQSATSQSAGPITTVVQTSGTEKSSSPPDVTTQSGAMAESAITTETSQTTKAQLTTLGIEETSKLAQTTGMVAPSTTITTEAIQTSQTSAEQSTVGEMTTAPEEATEKSSMAVVAPVGVTTQSLNTAESSTTETTSAMTTEMIQTTKTQATTLPMEETSEKMQQTTSMVAPSTTITTEVGQTSKPEQSTVGETTSQREAAQTLGVTTAPEEATDKSAVVAPVGVTTQNLNTEESSTTETTYPAMTTETIQTMKTQAITFGVEETSKKAETMSMTPSSSGYTTEETQTSQSSLETTVGETTSQSGVSQTLGVTTTLGETTEQTSMAVVAPVDVTHSADTAKPTSTDSTTSGAMQTSTEMQTSTKEEVFTTAPKETSTALTQQPSVGETTTHKGPTQKVTAPISLEQTTESTGDLSTPMVAHIGATVPSTVVTVTDMTTQSTQTEKTETTEEQTTTSTLTSFETQTSEDKATTAQLSSQTTTQMSSAETTGIVVPVDVTTKEPVVSEVTQKAETSTMVETQSTKQEETQPPETTAIVVPVDVTTKVSETTQKEETSTIPETQSTKQEETQPPETTAIAQTKASSAATNVVSTTKPESVTTTVAQTSGNETTESSTVMQTVTSSEESTSAATGMVVPVAVTTKEVGVPRTTQVTTASTAIETKSPETITAAQVSSTEEAAIQTTKENIVQTSTVKLPLTPTETTFAGVFPDTTQAEDLQSKATTNAEIVSTTKTPQTTKTEEATVTEGTSPTATTVPETVKVDVTTQEEVTGSTRTVVTETKATEKATSLGPSTSASVTKETTYIAETGSTTKQPEISTMMTTEPENATENVNATTSPITSCANQTFNVSGNVFTLPATSIGELALSAKLCDNGRSVGAGKCNMTGVFEFVTSLPCESFIDALSKLETTTAISTAVFLISSATNLNDTDVSNITDVLARSVSKANETNESDVQFVLGAFSNLKNNFVKTKNARLVEKMLTVVENFALKLNVSGSKTITQANVTIVILQRSKPEVGKISFPLSGTGVSITFPNSALAKVSGQDVKLVGVVSSDDSIFPKTNSLGRGTLTGGVVSITLGSSAGRLTAVTNLTNPIEIQWNVSDSVATTRAKFSQTSGRININSICTFLDPSTGQFSTEGLSSSPGSESSSVQTCQTKHLTSFAIFIEITFPPTPPTSSSIAGNAVVVGCLLIVVLIHISFRRLRGDPMSHLILQVCFTSLMAFILFLIASTTWSTLPRSNCLALASFQNIFLILAFGWVCFACIVAYRNVDWPLKWILLYARAEYDVRRNTMIKFSAIVYIPCIIVSVIIIAAFVGSFEPLTRLVEGTTVLDWSAFAGKDSCLIQGPALYYGFAVPAGLLFLVAIICAAIAVKDITIGHDKTEIIFQGYMTQFTESKHFAAHMFVYTTLFALTWAVACARIASDQLGLTYYHTLDHLFCALCVILGVSAVLLFCIRATHVRKLLERAFRNICGVGGRYYLPRPTAEGSYANTLSYKERPSGHQQVELVVARLPQPQPITSSGQLVAETRLDAAATSSSSPAGPAARPSTSSISLGRPRQYDTNAVVAKGDLELTQGRLGLVGYRPADENPDDDSAYLH